MSLKILTIFWGDKHTKLFEQACLKSLNFKQNREALLGSRAQWHIFTDEDNMYFVHFLVKRYMPEIDVRVRSEEELRYFTDPVQSALVLMMELCLKEKAQFLMAPPDTIFGDGSIHALLDIGEEPKSCIALPHPRVLPSILENINGDLPNSKLVTLAWEHLHKSWTDAEIGHPRQNGFVGGVYWREFQAGIYAVKHRLPTIYLANFTEEDLQYFKLQISSGHWDHKWPGDVLIPRGRQRMIGSSDAAFIMEITEWEKNVPPIWPGDPNDFWQKNPHNQINGMFYSVFRGD